MYMLFVLSFQFTWDIWSILGKLIFSYLEIFIIPLVSHIFISIICDIKILKTQCKLCKLTRVLAYTDYGINFDWCN